MDILHWFLDRIDNNETPNNISAKLKRRHLQTVENAKDYMFSNFYENISLSDIANHCNISLFHFSRIFKEITTYSPYNFLRDTRLSNAKQLLETSDLPINEICFRSGFQNVENFNTAFKDRYQYTPSYFKKSKNS
ncbi:helix-turn-helix transcriptional regulator [Maribellus maritimus]|uniref:helix-turn-helix transcriptional regulator n=1 Tax=Maribellus maritimus TaxID=2870838 RepID=UPI001EEC3FF1|nr:AraC family transcriptional regulator [Maribellus maritimus]MCG6189388.1 AraC family transcriptional regulator [Maribellus maritimus]